VDGGGPGPQRSRALPGSSRRLPPDSFTIPMRRAEGTIPSANADPPSKRSPPPAESLSTFGSPARCERAGDGGSQRTRIPALARPRAFQAVTAPWRLWLPRRKASDSNATVSPAHPLATEPGPWPVHLPRVREERLELSRPKSHGSKPCVAAITPPAQRVTDRIRTGPPTLAKSSANH
jgi:hypothetical protein